MFHQSGAPKKKLLTDPVSIIPFPNQDLRDKAPKATVAKPAVKPPLKKVFDRPEPKVLTAPSGTKKYASSLSINKMMAPKKEGEEGAPMDLSNMPMNDYHIDDFKMAWRRFAHILKENGDKTYYNALIKRDPIQKPDHLFILQLDSVIQVDTIRLRISELLGYIRKELRNYSIDVKLEITSNPDDEVKFQTGKDKFAALARKNPNLHTLKKAFNLDIEF